MGKHQNSLKVNILANALRTTLNFLFPLITFPYVSRILGPNGIGQFNFASSVVSYFVVSSAIGIPVYGTREVARYRDDKEKLQKIALELLSLNSIASAISYLLLFLSVILIPKFRENAELIAMLGASIAFTTLGMDWLFQGLEQYVYITIRSFIFQLLSVVLLFIFVRTPDDIIPYAMLSIFASGGANIVNFFTARKYFGHKLLRGEKLNIKRHLKPVFTMFGMNIAASIYTNLNSVMLGFFSGNAAVGYYSTSMKLTNIVLAMVTSVSSVLLPRSSYYIKYKQNAQFEALINKAFRFLLMIAFPCVVGMVGLRKEIIFLFAGASFGPSSYVLGSTSFLVLIIGLSNLLGIQILIPIGKEIVTFRSVLVGALVNLGLNILLMPSLAERGAAISIVVTEACITIYQLWFCRRYIASALMEWKKIIPYVLGCIIIVIILIVVNAIFYSPIVKICVAVPTSIILYIAVLLISRDEFIKEILIKENLQTR